MDKLNLAESVLDRLTPKAEEPGRAGRRFGLAELRAAVRRDLERLLNSRVELLDPAPLECGEIERSILLYGLPDFTAVDLSNPDHQKAVEDAIVAAVRAFEPRLRDVRVTVDSANTDVARRRLNFHIYARLRVEPRQDADFDALLELASHQYEVRTHG